jgi:hypothetical protein
VDDTNDSDAETWLEKVTFSPSEVWDGNSISEHPYLVEINYLEDYHPLSSFGYQFIDQVPYFYAGI